MLFVRKLYSKQTVFFLNLNEFNCDFGVALRMHTYSYEWTFLAEMKFFGVSLDIYSGTYKSPRMR